jgi:geranyl-CoA carboxylase beta subunit
MPVLESDIDTNGAAFRENAEFMADYVRKVRSVEEKQRATEEAYRPTAEKRGKLLPRERLALLLDPGAPFLEIGSIAGYNMYGDADGSTSGGNLITGIGYISGRRCLVVVWNFAIKGGTITPVTVRKMLRVQEIAFHTRLPVVQLHESGGGNLAGDAQMAQDPWAAVTFVDGGKVYCQQAELSAHGIPQITVAHGNATAGGAYQVALSDYIVLVKGQTQLFLAGPPLLKAATGAWVEAEELGGAEMHATISGTGEYLAQDDADGIRIAREIVAQLPADPVLAREGPADEPAYSPEELIGVVPKDRKVPYRVQEVIARIADGSRFFEFNPDIDSQTVCGHLQIMGRRCAVIGNNGVITPKGALKAAQFIALCDQSFTPVIFLQNTPGFLVGLDVERAGQVKHSAKLVQAVANMRGPKITVLVDKAYGAGNYAMASRALKPDFIFSWPTARQALMGGPQAASVMTTVAEEKAKKKGVEMTDAEKQKLAMQGQMISMGLELISESMYCSARLMDDGLIDPRDTRRVLAMALDTCLEAPHRRLRETSLGVPRL